MFVLLELELELEFGLELDSRNVVETDHLRCWNLEFGARKVHGLVSLMSNVEFCRVLIVLYVHYLLFASRTRDFYLLSWKKKKKVCLDEEELSL